MPCLISVFSDIMEDFSKKLYEGSSCLSRRFELKGKTILLISAYKNKKLAEISLSVYNNDAEKIGKLPKWKGMDQSIGFIPDQQENKLFISFKQAEDYDQKIYFTILQDIVDNIEDIENEKMLSDLKKVLEKWSVFFRLEKEYVLSDNAQQGLYAELYVLERMLKTSSGKIIECWTGCNAETHDFYLGKDALEVKSSSAKGPETIKVSNEYQLDDTGITGRLYLMYLKMRKSEVHGESLPVIVGRIMEQLDNSQKAVFQSKLLKVGYLYQLPELYVVHFIIHDECCYIVKDGFPRIIKSNISKGIGAVDYVVSLDACEKFLMTVETFYEGVNF